MSQYQKQQQRKKKEAEIVIISTVLHIKQVVSTKDLKDSVFA